MAAGPQNRLPIPARVAEILTKECSDIRPRPEEDDRVGHPGKALPAGAQGQVENEVLAVIQPLGVAADIYPCGASKRYRAAGWQEASGVDLAGGGKRGGRERALEDSLALGHEEAAGDVHVGIRLQRAGQPSEPGRIETDTRVGDHDDVAG